jgi:hypothetical protein
MGPQGQVRKLKKLKVKRTKIAITRVTLIREKIDFEDRSHVEQLHSHESCDGSTLS